MHGQLVTVVVVLPATVAVKVCTCPESTPTVVGTTVTVITFGPELLHPLPSSTMQAHSITAQLPIFRHCIKHFSLIALQRVSPRNLISTLDP